MRWPVLFVLALSACGPGSGPGEPDPVPPDLSDGLVTGVPGDPAWGRCRSGATGTAETEGVAVEELEALTNSLDVWVEVTEPVRVQVTGQAGFSVDPASDADRMLGDLFLHTVALDVCTGLQVRVGNRVWSPQDASPGQDIVLSAESWSTGDAPPLAYVRTGPDLAETPLHTEVSPSYTAGALLEYPLAVAPTGARVAGAADEAIQVTDLSGDLITIDVPGTSYDVVPWRWLDDGSGLMARSLGIGDVTLHYVDVDAGVGWEIGAGIDLAFLDFPTLSATGEAFFVSSDRILYRQPVLAPPPLLDLDDLVGWDAGTFSPTCDSGSGQLAAAVLDLGATVGEAYLVNASPGAVSPDGGRLLLQAPNGDGTWDLLVADVDGSVVEVIVEGWVPRAAADTVWDVWPGAAVSWLPNSKGIVYVDVGGVHRVTWETANVPTLVSISTGFLSPRIGPLVVSPAGTHFVVGEYRGPAWALYLDLWIVEINGGLEVGPLANRVEKGLPTWSADGAHLAYTEAATTPVSDLVVVGVDGSEVFDTRDWLAPNGVNSSAERFPTWAANMKGW